MRHRDPPACPPPRPRLSPRLRARLHYLWAEAPPDGVELLSASLSATFAVLLVYNGSATNAIQHVYWFAALCALAAALKLVGVLLEHTALRVAGLLLGLIFWVTLAGAAVSSVPGSITWLCYAVLALAQLWAVRANVRGRWR